MSHPDLLENSPEDSVGAQGLSSEAGDSKSEELSTKSQHGHKELDSLSEAKKAQLESHWRNAMQQATVIAHTTHQGKLPPGIERELGALDRGQLDWRSYLWRYLVKTPTDYTEFDRCFIGRGLYLETLQGESVKVYVAVDTSSSIDN